MGKKKRGKNKKKCESDEESECEKNERGKGKWVEFITKTGRKIRFFARKKKKIK